MQQLGKRIGRRPALLLALITTLTLAALGTALAFQPQPFPRPSPTPLITFAQPAAPPLVSSDQIGQIIIGLMSAGGLLLGLYVTLRKDSSKIATQTAITKDEEAQVGIESRSLINRLAAGSLQMQEDARAIRLAAETTSAAAAEIRSENTGLKSQIGTLEGTVTVLQDRIDSLEKTVTERGEEMAMKDKVNTELRKTIDDKDVVILRQADELVRLALNVMPPGMNTQPPQPRLLAPQIAAETIQKMEIINTDENPVPTTDMPGKPKP